MQCVTFKFKIHKYMLQYVDFVCLVCRNNQVEASIMVRLGIVCLSTMYISDKVSDGGRGNSSSIASSRS